MGAGAHGHERRGFTLIELLIALALFGMMSALAWRGLDSVLQSRAGVEAPGGAALELAAAWTQLEADLLAARATLRAPSRLSSPSPSPPLPHILASAQRLELLRAPAQCAGCWQGVVYDIARHNSGSVLRRRSTALYAEAETARAALALLASDTGQNPAVLPADTVEHVLLHGAAGMRVGVWQEAPVGPAAGLGAWLPLGLPLDYVVAAPPAAPRAQAKSALKVEWQLGAPWDGWVSKVVLLENRW